MEEKVILVDKDDKDVGTEEKIKAHKEAKLHRAFSVFVFNSTGELLIQKRAESKYHNGGVWSNTCCSHPRPGEAVEEAAHRRLKQEMGFDCDLKKVFAFIYKIDFNNGLWEHEFDHVFMGHFNGEPYHNTKEVEDWKWVPVKLIKEDMAKNPNKYTEWFKIAIQKFR